MSEDHSVEHHRAMGVTRAEPSARHSVSTERLRAAFEGMAVGMILKGAEGETLESNPALRRMLGYGEEELRGMTRSDYTHPEDVGRDADLYRQLLAGERDSFRMEKRYVRKDGSVMWGRLSVSRIEGAEGEPAFAVGVVEDITESREAAQEIERLNRQNWLILDSAGEGIYGLDTEGKITFVNPAATAMTGFDQEDLIGESQHEVVHHSYSNGTLYPGDKCPIYAALTDGGVHHVEDEVFWRKDGTSFPVEYTSTPIMEDGEVTGAVVTFTDVTERKETEEALKESEERYRMVVEQSAESIWLFDADTKKVLESNTAFQKLLGYTAEELRRMTNYDFVAHSRENIDSAVERVVQQRRGFFGERKYRRKDGRVLDVEVSGTVIPYKGREVVCGVARDLTERKRAEKALKQSEERYRAVIEQTIEGIYLGAADTKLVVESNAAFQKMLGYTAEELCGMHISDFIVHDHENIDSVFQRVLDRGHYSIGERKYRCKDGSIVDVETSATVISYDNSKVLCTVARDVTERKILEQQLKHRAFHDPLTDLPNRQLFLDRLEQALTRTERRGSGIAVLFMDLDGFKVVNDSLGHEEGDRLLVAVAERLRGCLRPEDTLARFAGDEFIVLLEGIEGADGALRVTQRITGEFLRPFVLDGRELVVRFSIGVALGDAHMKSPEKLLRDADTAMYRAKEDAADYRVFDPEMHEQAISRMELENDLRHALEKEEFTLYYQPKFRLGQIDTIEGVEALVRWEHPQRGFMLPDEFIHIAEETGLIIPIGGWVMKEACRQAKEWQERYPNEPPLAVCVNLSAGQVRHPGLLKDVRSALRESGLEPNSLILEITEGALLKDTKVIETFFKEVKALGVRLAIDDFGKEYSSLAYLDRLPVDGLKIDRLFLESFGANPSNTIIVEAVISLAHSLELEVTGEGVETAEQLKLLRRMGCDRVQGYHLAGPLPSEEVEQLLVNQLIP